MDNIEIRLVTLEPMRVASLYGFGEQPENQAWEKLFAYAKPRGFLDDPISHRIFGFNNPNPSAGSPNYGYEQWIQVDKAEQPEGEARILDFAGGLYAVTRCRVTNGNFDLISQTWQKLAAWCEDSHYKFGQHQWLEEAIDYQRLSEGELTLDLYLPIVDQK